MSAPARFSLLVLRYTQQHMANRACRVVTLMMALLFVAAGLRGGREAVSAREGYAQAVADDRAAWAEVQPEEWLAAGVRHGRWLYLPPIRAMALAEGVSKTQLASYHARVGLEPAHRLDLTDGVLSWTPELRRLGSLDLSFLVLMFLPLWAIFVSYDAVCGEKARGTLRIALASGVSRRRLLSAKALALWIAVWVPLMAAIVLGTVSVPSAAVDAPRLVSFMCTTSVYLAFYLGVGLLASTCTPYPRTALGWAMSVWVISSFVLPRASVLVAHAIHARPSSVLHEVEKRAALAETRRNFVEEYHAGATPHWMIERLIVAARTLDQEEALQRDYERRSTRARITEERFSWTSPFGLAYSSILEVSGTGMARYEHFREQARAYRRELTNHFARSLELLPKTESDDMRLGLPSGEATRILSRTPTFTFHDVALSEVLSRAFLRIGAILCLALFVLFVTVYKFDRYDVR